MTWPLLIAFWLGLGLGSLATMLLFWRIQPGQDEQDHEPLRTEGGAWNRGRYTHADSGGAADLE